MHVVLIINPTSGISTVTSTRISPEETEEAILAALRSYNIEPELYHTTPEDTGQGLAARVAGNADIVIAAGGDGTIHAVAKGLIGRQAALGIIPTGTMNNLARSLGVPTSIEEACAAIATGETHSVDIGRINDRVFLEVAGVGIEAALFPAGEEMKRRGLINVVHGVFSGLRTLFTYKSSRLRISINEHRRRPYKAIQVTICNSPFYGPHFQIAPNILMDDGYLDLFIYRNFNKLEYIRHAISISQGRRVFEPRIRHLRVKSLQITADEPLEIQADGVIAGYTPAKITIVPVALRVRVPGTSVSALHNQEHAEKEYRSVTANQ